MSGLFSTLVYDPLYNILIFLISVVPGGDVGLAVILLTIFVKLVLLPLSLKAVRTQMMMREIEQPLKEIQEKYKDDRQKQAEKMLALYREKGIHPFSSVLLLLIQLPVIFGLYFVVLRGGLPSISPDLLYTFISVPENVSMMFLGIADMGEKSILLAFIAAATQFIQAKYSLPPLSPRNEATATFKDDLARSFHLQIKYVLPIIVFGVSYAFTAVIALYWTTSNIFTILQELYVRRNIRPVPAVETKPVQTEK